MTTNLAAGDFKADDTIQFPYRFRHGSVLPLTVEEYARVKGAFGSVAPAETQK